MSFKHLVLLFRQLIFYGFFCDVFFFGVCHTLSLKSQFVMNLYIYHVSVIKLAYSTSVGMMGLSGQNLNTVVRLCLKDGIICCHKAPNVVN